MVDRNSKTHCKDNASPPKKLPNPMHVESKPIITRLLQQQNLFHTKQMRPDPLLTSISKALKALP